MLHKKSIVWKYYKKPNSSVAVCSLCNKKFCFNGSTTTLLNHLKRKHPQCITAVKITNSSGNSNHESKSENVSTSKNLKQKSKLPTRYKKQDDGMNALSFKSRKILPKKSIVWEYCKKITCDVAICLLCHQTIRYYKSTSNLMRHLKKKHHQTIGSLSVSDSIRTPTLVSEGRRTHVLDDEDDDNEGMLPVTAVLQKYYNKTSNHTAVCTICNKSISFHGSNSNLTDHFTRKHGISFPLGKVTDSECFPTEVQLSTPADLIMDQQFSLRWNNYPSQITDAFGSLRDEEDLVDVTLSCEGRRLRAHKMLLSACSVYFRDIFRENPCQHPVIVFRNVKYADLEAIVDFMYKGEVNVRQDHLESFLGTAELLEVKGLTDGPGKEVHMEEEDGSGRNKKEIKTVPKPLSTRTLETSGIQPPVSSGPHAKKRKYSIPSIHRKPLERKQRPDVDESPTLPVVTKDEKPEYIEDLTYDEDEVNLPHPATSEPLQMPQRKSKQPASEVDLNSSSNFSQEQDTSTLLTPGQTLVVEPGTSLEGFSLETVQAEDDDHCMVEEMVTVELEIEAEEKSDPENLCDDLEGENDDSKLNDKTDVSSHKDDLKDKAKCLSRGSANEKRDCEGKHFVQQPDLRKDLPGVTAVKPILSVKELNLAHVITFPKGLNVTISPVVNSQVQDDMPKSHKDIQDTQPSDEFVTLRSEEAKTPVNDDLQAYQCTQGYQGTKPFDVTSMPEPAILTEQFKDSEPETAEKAPEMESEQDFDHVSEEEEVEEEPTEPEFDYYGCQTCKEDGKPVLDKFNFTHRCPICPCMCFCAHLLKEHMRVIHGWFNVQRRFQQY